MINNKLKKISTFSKYYYCYKEKYFIYKLNKNDYYKILVSCGVCIGYGRTLKICIEKIEGGIFNETY